MKGEKTRVILAIKVNYSFDENPIQYSGLHVHELNICVQNNKESIFFKVSFCLLKRYTYSHFFVGARCMIG